ncbi:hypothetical protein WICMUC_001892 [Wickerhamomyces mucosus]|uniref:Uncharacterized protein n=1 Tax=Wickerhamomyces mucosus TaxID=1378264 RepID=A0A9P8PS58_9ASCO|nr:hypothetical protein WICMUC_001892 [Wickerhamomyces mucosus]
MSSIFKVPTPVKDLFDKFPLVEYPATQQLTSDEKDSIKSRTFNYINTPSSIKSQYSFKLGVYNTFLYDDNLVLSSDPLCLSLQISLALNNNLKLSKSSTDIIDLKKNSIYILNENATPEGILPIYIEENAKNNKTLVKNYESVNESLMLKVNSNKELILINLVDFIIYDYYIISVLFQTSKETQSLIYQFESSQQDKFLNKLHLSQSLSNLIKRNGFTIRYPNISTHFSFSSKLYISSFLQSSSQAINHEIIQAYESFKEALENLFNIYDKSGFIFFNNNEIPNLIDVKLSSYILVSGKLLKGSNFDKEFLKYPKLQKLSRDVLRNATE